MHGTHPREVVRKEYSNTLLSRFHLVDLLSHNDSQRSADMVRYAPEETGYPR